MKLSLVKDRLVKAITIATTITICSCSSYEPSYRVKGIKFTCPTDYTYNIYDGLCYNMRPSYAPINKPRLIDTDTHEIDLDLDLDPIELDDVDTNTNTRGTKPKSPGKAARPLKKADTHSNKPRKVNHPDQAKNDDVPCSKVYDMMNKCMSDNHY